MLPTSHVVQPELIHVGEFRRNGGFADVSKGEYCGRPVAVKQLRIEKGDEFGNIFKVSNRTQLDRLQPLTPHPATLPGSTYLETPVSSQRFATAGGFRV